MAKAKLLKKHWYPIIAPSMFRNVTLGETLVYEPNQMLGKNIRQNLMSLTNDVKRQNINVNFEVVSVENMKGHTNITGYSMVSSSVKRMVRRNINKIDMSFECPTADKKNVCIKPILITRSATSNSVATRLRKTAQDFLTKQIGSLSYDNFTNDLISHKLQSSLKAHLKKIYPLKVCEISSMHILRERNDIESKELKPKKNEEVKQETKPKESKEESKKAEKSEEKKTIEMSEETKDKEKDVPKAHDLEKSKEEKVENKK